MSYDWTYSEGVAAVIFARGRGLLADGDLSDAEGCWGATRPGSVAPQGSVRGRFMAQAGTHSSRLPVSCLHPAPHHQSLLSTPLSKIQHTSEQSARPSEI